MLQTTIPTVRMKSNISIEQTNKLLHILSDVSDALPEDVNESIEAILEAQSHFLKVVDRFVHNVDDVSKAGIVKDIIDTCPHFLSSRNKHGLLPIHTACFRDSCSTFVPLFANAGVKHGVGGHDGRGGLLMETSKGNNAYELLAGSTDAIYANDKCLVDTMKVLMKQGDQSLKEKNRCHELDLYPRKPLLWEKELHQPGFLLNALTNERIAMTKFLISFDPTKVYKSVYGEKSQGNVGTWPIHIAVNTYGTCTDQGQNRPSFKLFQYLLQCGMKYRSFMLNRGLDDYVGGLFAVDGRTKKTTFELAMESFGEEQTWKSVTKYVPPSTLSSLHKHNNYHILQRAITLPLKYFNGFIWRYPRAYFARDNDGCLPIHHALFEGMEWSTELISIINANINSLHKPDPRHQLYPFALAAAGPNSDLSSIFYMLTLHPEHISRSALEEESKRLEFINDKEDCPLEMIDSDSSANDNDAALPDIYSTEGESDSHSLDSTSEVQLMNTLRL